MHRDANGRLHLAVAFYGPWSRTLDRDLEWLFSALPPRYRRSRRQIQWEDIWFLQVQVLLPVERERKEVVQLHVSAMTGTVWSSRLGKELVDAADGVVFVATTEQHRLETTVEAHREFQSWLDEGRPLIYQFDEPYAGPDERLTPAQMAARLDLGDRPWFASYAYEGKGVPPLFREITRRGLHSELRERPLLAPIEPL